MFEIKNKNAIQYEIKTIKPMHDYATIPWRASGKHGENSNGT